MMPYKQNVDLSEFPVVYFTATNRDRSIEVHPHWHNAIEILYVTCGTANQQIGDNMVQIEKGDIVIIWSDQFHSTYSVMGESCEILVLQISTDIFINSFIKSEAMDKIRNIFWADKIDSKSELGEKILHFINQTAEELKNKNEGYYFKVCGILHSFIGEILRNQEILPVHQIKKYSENDKMTALRVFKFIEENYNEDITLEKIASEVNLSVSHFLRVFKNVSGMTFKQYLNYFRISKSIELLKDGAGVTESAIKSGFSDVNTYIRNFKKYRGATPSKYKN